MATQLFDALNARLGHGEHNHANRSLWFIGVEEGGGFNIEPNKTTDASAIERLRERYDGSEWALVPLSGASVSGALRYQSQIGSALSRSNNSPKDFVNVMWTQGHALCNVNLFPLAKRRMNEGFPAEILNFFGFSEASDYTEIVRNTRWRRIRSVWNKSNPQATVCYGKGRWHEFIEMLSLDDAECDQYPAMSSNKSVKVFEEKKNYTHKAFLGAATEWFFGLGFGHSSEHSKILEGQSAVIMQECYASLQISNKALHTESTVKLCRDACKPLCAIRRIVPKI